MLVPQLRLLDNLIIYSYDNIPQIKKLDYPVNAIGVPTSQIAEQIVAILNKIINGEDTEASYDLHPEQLFWPSR